MQQPAIGALGDGGCRFRDGEREWLATWHEATEAPTGQAHGSAGACITPRGGIVLVSADGGQKWQFPGGHPEGHEDWRATLEREVLEEACARVDGAMLLGFTRLQCQGGMDEGAVLVRSLWRADVTLLPWRPRHEMTHRRVVGHDAALDHLNHPPGVAPLYAEWLRRALGRP